MPAVRAAAQSDVLLCTHICTGRAAAHHRHGQAPATFAAGPRGFVIGGGSFLEIGREKRGPWT